MPDLELIGMPQSNFVWVARIAATEKGVPYTLNPAPPHSPDALAVSPLGKIPALRHGAVTLAESKAICTYLDRAFDGPALIPADPADAARVEQWVSLVTTSFDPVCVRQYLLAYMFPGTPDGAPDRGRIDAAVPKMQQLIALLEGAVGNGFLVGDGFTLADAFVVPILFYLQKAPESAAALAASPAVTAYLQRHLARPSVAATLPPPFPGR
jgi:glutathione S-transferase